MTHQKKTYGHQLGPMTHFLTATKFDLLLYMGRNVQKNPIFITFSGKKRSNWKKIKKSCCGHQLWTMTYFSKYHTFDPLLYLGCQMLRTHFFFTFSAKKRSNNKIFGKKTYGHQLGPMTHFLTTPKFDLLSYIYIINFLNLPVCALIHDLQKKTYRHQLGPMTHFLTTPKFDLLLYIREKCLRTHLQSFLCVP